MAFWLFTGSVDEFFPSRGLTARVGKVYDFGNDSPPLRELPKELVTQNAVLSPWTSSPGPATDYFISQASDLVAALTAPVPLGGAWGSWIYGDGSAGAKTATDGAVELGGCYTDYTIPPGVTVQAAQTYASKTGAFPAIIMCTGTFTINGTLDLSGANAVGRLQANTAISSGAGNDGVQGVGDPSSDGPFVSGAGGNGSSGAGGAAGVQNTRLHNPFVLLTATLLGPTGHSVYPNVIGGGGGAGDGTNYGGAGADPGRWCLVIARRIVYGVANSFNLQGGNGGIAGDDGTGSTGHGNCGGGGGGAGGWWVDIADTVTGTANAVGSGGAGGVKSGTGTNGQAGQDGQGIHYYNQKLV